jgi:hypothetical protein
MCSFSHVHRPRQSALSHIAPSPRHFYVRWLRVVAVVSTAAVLTACAAATPGAGPPDLDTAARLAAATTPDRRLHVVFDWDMRDRDARFNGRGVLRLDLQHRARVDLFGPRGETLSAAIVDGEQMRVVPAGTDALLPPPALLWAALGVFRQPMDAPLTGTSHADGRWVLEYGRDDVRWRFRFEEDRLRSTEWTARGGRRTVELSGAAAFGLPAVAAFRDWTEFRELTLRVTDVEERTEFAPDVWILPGA